jgi:FKBP-type peptidyl-prolyl cis-trans isomerase 2
MKSQRSCSVWLFTACLGILSYNATAEEGAMVEDGKTIAIEYTLKLDDGTVASTNVGQDPLSYVQGGEELLPALQDSLAGMRQGQSKEVMLAPEQGYGFVDDTALVEVPVDMIPEEARVVGARLVGRDQQGNEQFVRVREVQTDRIVLDHNHPLAGENLHFDVKVLSVE